jgi:hypothetical protein
MQASYAYLQIRLNHLHLLAAYLLGLLLDPEDGGSACLGIVGKLLQEYTVSLHRR